MAQVTIEVNGRDYVVGCEDGQERRLAELAASLDAQIRQVARDVSGRALSCGHYIPEEAPTELVSEMLSFFEAVEQ